MNFLMSVLRKINEKQTLFARYFDTGNWAAVARMKRNQKGKGYSRIIYTTGDEVRKDETIFF